VSVADDARVFRAASVDSARPFAALHPLPKEGPFDRHRALIEAACARSVLHLGFVDEQAERKLEEGVWLHARLAEVAQSLVGVDSSSEGVEWARARGYEAYVVDVQSQESIVAAGLKPAEVLIAAELIEHLDAPGPFLRAVRPLVAEGGVLVLTTPNAYRLVNVLAPLTGSEIVHADHTAWHSPQTLRTLLRQCGWEAEEMAYYHNPLRTVPEWLEGKDRLAAHMANVARRGLAALGRRWPYWSEGIVVWARPLTTYPPST
jgi:SAM-dependent methyltransferase